MKYVIIIILFRVGTTIMKRSKKVRICRVRMGIIIRKTKKWSKKASREDKISKKNREQNTDDPKAYLHLLFASPKCESTLPSPAFGY